MSIPLAPSHMACRCTHLESKYPLRAWTSACPWRVTCSQWLAMVSLPMNCVLRCKLNAVTQARPTSARDVGRACLECAKMSAHDQRAREAVDKRRSGGGSEEDLSQMEMEEYTTEAEKKSLVDRQVRLSSSYFDMLH